MNQTSSLDLKNSASAAAAFDGLAADYDTIWTDGIIGTLQRRQVWQDVRTLFRSGDRVLEIGCGTGVDAVHLAQTGLEIHAIDISPKMLRIARDRIERAGLQTKISLECRPIEQLSALEHSSAFAGAFSNFGAFNCTSDLHAAASNLAELIRPGGKVAICLMNRYCLWETAWFLSHGRPTEAFRRANAGKGGREASLSSSGKVRVFYPCASKIIADFEPHFAPVSSQGIGVLVPPSCMAGWAIGKKVLLGRLAAMDGLIRHLPIIRALGDHRLFIFVRRNRDGRSERFANVC